MENADPEIVLKEKMECFFYELKRYLTANGWSKKKLDELESRKEEISDYYTSKERWYLFPFQALMYREALEHTTLSQE